MKRSIFWRGVRWLSLEHLRLEIAPTPRADALLIGDYENTPFRVRYALECDQEWRVHHLLVEDVHGENRITLAAEGHGQWRREDGRIAAELGGCIDVDIAVTPFTNTLPIRRLQLDVGVSSEIDVVYVAAVPKLELRRVRQRYTLLELHEGTARYLYEAVASGFQVELVVDPDGLVVNYPGVWERCRTEEPERLERTSPEELCQR